MKIKVKEKFVDSISGKKIYANKAENTTNGLNIDDSISSLSSTIKTKQNKLTFAGENNTITAINSSAIKVDLTDYYTKSDTSGKDEISTALETKADAIARVGGDGPLFGENMKFRFAPEGGTNLNLQEYDSSTDEWTDIGVIVTKENKGPNKILKTDNRNVLQWIDTDYYTKSETSAASSISAALDGKEDKIFVAEYNVTPYADIKAAYDAGKQIICKFYENKEQWPEFVRLLRLSQYLPMGPTFYFEALTNYSSNIYVNCGYYDNDTHWSYSNNSFYKKTETSGSQQLSDALALKQDKLTFSGEDNTITAINNSAIGGGTEYTAGTDLNIVDGVIKVNTNGSVEGDYSFVEGFNTSAIGHYSHAEGSHTLASGQYTHTEGYRTKTLDSCAHAEGYETSAKGYCSHAEGYQTSANGEWSHVEGSNTSAVKQGSHSEGTLTLASGVNSHAEGNNTSATNNESHSEGYGTLAQGKQSHAEGYYTIAGDDYMHAGGKFNKTSADVAFVIGNGTATTNRSDAFIVDWNGTASATKLATSGITDIEATINSLASVGGYAVVASTASITNPDTKTIYLVKDTTVTGNDQYKEYICTNTATPTYEMIGDTSIDLSNYYSKSETSGSQQLTDALALKQDNLTAGTDLVINNGVIGVNTTSTAIGNYAFAEGDNSSAKGNYSHAEGANSLANGIASHSEGWSTSAIGKYSHAEGDFTSAVGYYSHTEGYKTSALGKESHAEGSETVASGDDSHAAGSATIAFGNCSVAFGMGSQASGNAAFAEGIASSAFGEGSHAEGGEVHYGLSGTLASGTASHSEGVRTSAIGDFSHSEGIGTLAIGAGSHAEGGEVHYETLSGTIASGIASHSEGVRTSAIGDYSHAEGMRTIASDDSSHSEGNGTSAIGRNSHAAGCETIAEDDEMFVCGRANKTTSGAAFVVGNGYCSTAEWHAGSDAFIVKWNGVASAKNLQTSAGYVVTDVMLTSATNSTTSFVTNGKADLTPLYTYIKSLEDRIAALEDAQGGFTVNGVQPTVNGNTITVGE